MKVKLVSKSANSFVEGQKVIVKIAEDEWYAGIITKCAKNGKTITVDFNDGTDAKIDQEDYGDVKPINVKGKKSAYTAEDAKAVYSAAPASAVKPPKKEPRIKPPKPGPRSFAEDFDV